MTPDEARILEKVRAEVRRKNIGYSVRGGPIRDPNGEPEGIVSSPDKLVKLHASTDILVRDIAAKLTEAMPGFRWAIQPSEVGRVFNIFCLDFSSIWGYRIRYDDIMNDPRRREALRAGREILRRFRYQGTRYDSAQIAKMPRNVRGEVPPAVDDLPKSRFTKRAWLEHEIATGKARIVGQAGKGQIIETKG